MMKRNPKQVDTNLFDCIPQVGPCPNDCNQCFYNHGFYLPINTGHFPTLEEIGDGIVRVNSGHDSNFQRDHVIGSTEHYPKRFFNTALPIFDFPDPVVFTANREEEELPFLPRHFEKMSVWESKFQEIMFVRLRVSSTNLYYIIQAAEEWGEKDVPVVLTFMRYYDENVFKGQNSRFYDKREHINNIYWCPTEEFIRTTLDIIAEFNFKIEMCGSPMSSLCKDCLLCEKYYYEAKGRMDGRPKT